MTRPERLRRSRPPCGPPDDPALLDEKAVLELRAGRAMEAATTLQGIVARRPENFRGFYNLGLALGQTGRVEEAKAAYEKAIALRPRHLESHINLGMLALDRGDASTAAAIFEKATGFGGGAEKARTWFSYGVALGRLGRREEAMAAYDKAIEYRPDYLLPRYNQAQLLLTRAGSRDAARAEQILRQALALGPEFAPAWFLLGRIASEQGRDEDALERDTSRLRRAGATLQLGKLDAAEGLAAGEAGAAQRDRARALFTEVQVDFADTSYADDASYAAGRLLYDEGDHARARDALAAFERAWPASGLREGARYYQGRALEALDDFGPAEALYRTWPAEFPEGRYPDNADYRLGRVPFQQAEALADGDAEARAERYRAARTAFDAFLEAWPTSSLVDGARYHRGRAAYELGDLRAAEIDLAAVGGGSVYADNAGYYLGRSRYDRAERDGVAALEAAIEAFDRLLATFPASDYADDAAYFRARALFRMPRMEAARAAFEALVVDYPDSPYVDNALYYSALAALASGDCAAGASAAERRRAAFPEAPDQADLEARVRACQGAP